MHAPKFWYLSHVSPMARILQPLSWIYGLLQYVDQRVKSRRPYYPGVPLISVGNITVGGTGKTPLVALLSCHYAREGNKVAIISKGYGGRKKAPHRVLHNDTADIVGDEPLMLAKHVAGESVDVWVGSNRKELAIRAEQAGATLLILDDGFQQYGLIPSINIIVIDGTLGYGNAQLLPAGPLREPLHHLKRAHFGVVIAPLEENTTTTTPVPYYGLPAYHIHPHLSEADIKPLASKPVIAIAAIGNPVKFFTSLDNAGLILIKTYAYPDHYALKTSEWMEHIAEAETKKAHLVCTAKDYVKLPKELKEKITPINLSLVGAAIESIYAEIDKSLV